MGNIEGETTPMMGSLLGSVRWDSGWQGGSGRRKTRRRKRREWVGEEKRDMATADLSVSHDRRKVERGRG